MPALPDISKRNMIPRWRSSTLTYKTSETSSFGSSQVNTHSFSNFEEKISSWRKNKSLVFASDLINSAFVLNKYSEAEDAAKYIIRHHSESENILSNISKIILDENINSVSEGITNFDYENHVERSIHSLKKRLSEQPNNPILCVDIAKEYVILGETEKSEKYVRMANYLAPNNRFVLRSACRYYIHVGRPQMAMHLLNNKNYIINDPWLLSTEIAVNSVLNKKSTLKKYGENIIKSNQFHPKHISELAAAIATQEQRFGKSKINKYINLVLKSPTDNSIAQIVSLRTEKNLKANYFTKNIPYPFEADAIQSYRKKEWQNAIYNTKLWFFDQPFSKGPAIHGSYVSSVCLNNHDLCIKFAKQGLIANSNNTILLNNLTVSLIHKGLMDEAQLEFKRIDHSQLSDREKIVWFATSGLFLFRSDHIEKGREYYLKAIELAQKKSEKYLSILALLYLTLEEQRLHTNEFETDYKKSIEVTNDRNEPDIEILIKRLNEGYKKK